MTDIDELLKAAIEEFGCAPQLRALLDALTAERAKVAALEAKVAALEDKVTALEREAKAEPVAWLLRFGVNGQYRSVSIVHPGATYADQELTPLYESARRGAGG